MRVVDDDADVRGGVEVLAAELLRRAELLELAELLACREVESADVDPIGSITVLVAPLDNVCTCVVLSEGSAVLVPDEPPCCSSRTAPAAASAATAVASSVMRVVRGSRSGGGRSSSNPSSSMRVGGAGSGVPHSRQATSSPAGRPHCGHVII